ncbi:SLAM family member 7-like isoform X1 [Labeo rohita]|uniref:SLAM family member 7-like isoform X1 n=1 Tax=Labeo rohita TaxID=84645 RepID=A0A498LEL8_LABRO|nr:SLAM family member 7-like isoform X1 [Labeo rohita]
MDINSKEQEQRFLLNVVGYSQICMVSSVTAEDQTKAVGDRVSFRPSYINTPVTSVIWKQRSSTAVFKVIEWDDDGIVIPIKRFQDITTLNEKTGQITITNLAVDHSGVYTIDINSKEQEQRFKLEVLDVATVKRIIWKNSTGETLEGLKDHLPGEFIKDENKRNPDNFYTCTLVNADLKFEDSSA